MPTPSVVTLPSPVPVRRPRPAPSLGGEGRLRVVPWLDPVADRTGCAPAPVTWSCTGWVHRPVDFAIRTDERSTPREVTAPKRRTWTPSG